MSSKPRTCELCGADISRDPGRCTNGRCAACHATHCTPGGDTSPGHGTAPAARSYTIRCSCGYTDTFSTREAAVNWKRWHREQQLAAGQRLTDTGHVVTITRVDVRG